MAHNGCRPAIASMSLGRAFASHDLLHKIDCAAAHGFKGIEIFYECLDYHARTISLSRRNSGASLQDTVPTNDEILTAAEAVRDHCKLKGIEIIGLQPFLFYEGVINKKEHAALIEKLHFWFNIVKALGTDLIQIPTQFRPADGQITGDLDTIVNDLLEVAELGLQETPPVRFAYENLAWGTFIDTWEGVWDVVRRVNRWNFGVCLDTFNITGRVWADPAKIDGTVGVTADGDLKASVERLERDVDLAKLWYVQVVGAERLSSPLVAGHEWHVDGQPPRMSWSRNARLFYGEEDQGQYLPIENVSRAILMKVDEGGLGFKGWVSMELFSRTMNDPSKEVPEKHAARGEQAWKKLVSDLYLPAC